MEPSTMEPSKAKRDALFKKAQKVADTGADVAVILLQSASDDIKKKLYSFGYPDVDSVVDLFLSNRGERSTKRKRLLKGKKVDDGASADGDHSWWKEPVEDMKIEELKEYVAALKELKEVVTSTLECQEDSD